MSFTRHAAERAAERYGSSPSGAEWGQAVLDITDAVLGLGDAAVLLARIPNNMERWLVRIGSSPMVAIYSPILATIITVQPPNTASRFNTGATARVSKRLRGRCRDRSRYPEDYAE